VWLDRAVGPAAVERTLDDVEPATQRAVLDLAHRPATLRTTSIGRLFDAVASLLVGRRRVSYEAQAAIELEAMARAVDRRDAPVYDGTVAVRKGEGDGGPLLLDPAGLVARVVAERERGTPPAVVAAAFHETIGRAAADLAIAVAERRGLDTVALTGGVFQNLRLTEVAEQALANARLTVLVHQTLPPNDGAISIGQAAIAAFASQPEVARRAG